MLVIKNGKLIDPISSLIKENKFLFIENNQIKDFSEEEIDLNNYKIIDASNKWIIPGLIDIHCHLREPGFTHKETIETGSESALEGGFTTICPMANTMPVIDNPLMLEYINLKAEKLSKIQILQHSALTKELKGQEIVEMSKMLDYGAVAFSDDGQPYENLFLLRTALQHALDLNCVIISHSEDKKLSANGSVRLNKYAIQNGFKGIPSSAESSAIAREIEVLREFPKARLHFAHISTKASVELIRKAKNDGLAVSADTTPHHIVLIESAIEKYYTNAKMNPPLGNEEDRIALIEGLRDGTIDAIATDHAPHSKKEKSESMDLAPFGICGFETAFSLTMTELLKNNFSILKLIELFTLNPLKCLKIKNRDISLGIGSEANITIIDPNFEWIFSKDKTSSKAQNSPFYDWKFKGKPIYTIYKGKLRQSNYF